MKYLKRHLFGVLPAVFYIGEQPSHVAGVFLRCSLTDCWSQRINTHYQRQIQGATSKFCQLDLASLSLQTHACTQMLP